jgi:DinB superfamily
MDLAEATTVLARTPGVLDTLLDGLPPRWLLHRADGPGTWSAYDIVGHLVHAEATNWLPRIRMIIVHGTDRSFEPFDREAMLTWDREPADALVARLRSARRTSLKEVSSMHLTIDDLARRGSHPEMGEVTLGQVFAAWVAHDLTHLAQIGEALARCYRTEVGPYRKYMPALDRVAAAE